MARGLKNVSKRWSDALSRTGWADVERLLAVYYRGQGWSVEHCGTGAGNSRFDGGVDLKLRRDDEYVLVQAKHWNAYQIPHNDIHQLIGVMVNEGATGAIVVTSGEFTAAAIEAANKLGHVQLVDGAALREMIGPLPEPGLGGTAEQIVDVASDVLKATEGYRRRRGARGAGSRAAGGIGALATGYAKNTAKAVAVEFAVKAIGVVVIVLIFVWAMQRVSNQLTQATAPTRTAPASAPTAQEPASTFAAPATQQQSAPTATPQPLTDSSRLTLLGPRAQRHTIPPGCVLIDHFSGTYSCDPEPGASPPRQPTPAEIRESQRKADEAIRVLEGRVQEM